MSVTDARRSRFVRFGVFEVDLQAGELRKAGARIALQEQPLRVLARLLETPSELVTRDDLRRELWGGDTYVGFEHGLNVAIRRLRDALGDAAETPRFIETLPRRGYRFIAPLEAAAAPDLAGKSRRSLRRWLLAAAGALVALSLEGWRVLELRRAGASHRPIRSVAVLPLRNLTGDPSQDWFADAMTEALSSTLSQIGSLTVVSSTSSLRYRNSVRPTPTIAKELGGVEGLLEGSVTRNGGRVRVMIDAVDVATDRRLWTATYERDAADVLSLYSDIAIAAAREMSLALKTVEEARIARTPIVNPEGYEAYLRGSYLMTRWHDGGCYEAKRYFRRAIDLDPDFAPPYGALAYCSCFPVRTHQTAADLNEARAATAQALRRDDRLAIGHVASAFVKMRFDYDWPGAEAEYKRALDLDPGSPAAHMFYAEFLDVVGRDQQAIAEMRHAVRLSPFWMDHNVAFGYLLARLGQYDAAIEQLRKTLELDSNYVSAWLWLAETHAYKGDRDAAVRAWLEYLDRVLVPGRVAELRAVLEHAYAQSGEPGFWRRELELAEEEVRHPSTVWKESFARHCSAYFMARRYARVGRWDQTLTSLEQGYRERQLWMVFIGREPLFDPIRQDRRFQDLVSRMGLTR